MADVLIDPGSNCPKPPFKRQSQPWAWPGAGYGTPPRSRRDQLSRIWSTGQPEGAHHRGDSGMGRAAAIAYAREGGRDHFLPAEQPDADEVLKLIAAEGRKGIGIAGDLKDEAFCRSLVERVIAELGGLDIIVNNAGQQTWASIMDVTSEDFDATMKTNVYAPFWIIKAALPHLKPGSAIIGTSSEQAIDPSAELYDYARRRWRLQTT